MRKKNKIKCLNNSTEKEYLVGTSLMEIIEDQNITLKYPIVGARVNNEIEELSYEIFKPKIVEFFDITNVDGRLMYIRSLSFVLLKAVVELFPKAVLNINHSVSKGFYCEIENLGHCVTDQTVTDIKAQMKKIISNDLPFVRNEILVTEAIKIFRANNYSEKVKLFETCTELYTSIYKLGDWEDYFYGYLIPSTGYLQVFDLVKYYDGMLLQVPKSDNPESLAKIVVQDKMYDIFREYKSWANILGVPSIGSLNQTVLENNISELIKISEALHEKKLAQIADIIYTKKDKIKLILISGPSSSGKTTFSMRLAIYLRVLGLQPVQISLDDYFVNREHTPKDENGEYDFENLEALDVKLFNADLLKLLRGEEIKRPKFSFEEGKRFYNGDTMQLAPDNIIIVEGIHGLNPKLTEMIDVAMKFKVYVSALTQLGIDGHNRIPTTDNRLIRRIIRDNRYRGYSALDTLRRWQSVRRGEERNIFPYQEEADIMFNSAMLFELGVLKSYAEPLLEMVLQNEPEYSEAQRLLKFLSYFNPIHPREIPPTSILREFLGGSSFDY